MKQRGKKRMKNIYWYLFFILLSFRVVTWVFVPDKSESEKDFFKDQLEHQYSEIKNTTDNWLDNSLKISLNRGVSKYILISIQKVHFDLNKYDLSNKAKKVLLSIVGILNRSNIVIIEGHTDSSGPDDFNECLSF